MHGGCTEVAEGRSTVTSKRVHRLTDPQLRAAPAGTILREEVTPCLEYRAGRNGRGSWRVYLRSVVDGAQRRRKIGSYPEMSLRQARDAAALRRAARTEKRDTFLEDDQELEAKRAAARAKAAHETFQEAVQGRYARHVEATLKVPGETLRKLAYVAGTAVRGVPIGSMPLVEITRSHLAALHRDMTENRGPIQANRCLESTAAFFSWAASADGIEGMEGRPNPAAGIRRNPAAERSRVLSDDELAAVWRAATSAPYPHGHFARLVLLTGCRGGEILGLRWQPDPKGSAGHVDRAGGKLQFPAGATKNGREHVVYINDAIADVLNAFPSISSQWCFASDDGRYSNCRDLWKRRMHAASGTSGWTWHDLRRTVVSGMQALGTSEAVLRKLINHASGTTNLGVLGVYARHGFEKERRAALEQWAAHLSQLAAGANKPAASA